MAMSAGVVQVRMPNPPPPLQRMGGMQVPADARRAQLARAVQRRHQLIREDVNRLVEIGTALQSEVAKTPAGTVSTQSLQLSEELEKLAKRLKKELRGDM
jgi:hypothetical protein